MSLIFSQSRFEQLCVEIVDAGIVAFDTEFVSESYYRPRLCLLQLAFDDEIVAIDPFKVTDLSPWWEIMTNETTTVVAHGSREEVRFCLFATGQRPRKLVDVQIAEGLRSRGFPLSHANLVSRVLGVDVKHGKQTRTDWERRPLSDDQIRYALDDVRYLVRVWETQAASLQEMGRLPWATSEFEQFIEDIVAEEDRDGSERLSGFFKLNRRDMATAKALYDWRDEIAFQKNRPPRRILRDDLLIDIAKRHPKSVKDLNMVRDMNRRDYQQYSHDLLRVVKESRKIPEDELPRKPQGKSYPSQDEVLARILGLALANRCQELGISMPLVGTSSDLKELVRWHVFDQQQGARPKLLSKWRESVCGQVLLDVLDGKVTLRVADPRSENPLRFDDQN